MKHFIFGISLFIGGILGNGSIFIAVGVSGHLSRNILGSIEYTGLLTPFAVFSVLSVIGVIMCTKQLKKSDD